MQSWVQALGGTAVIVAVAIRVGERRVVEGLEAAGAVDPGSATKLASGNFLQKWQFGRLLTAGVLGETMDQAQYLKLAEYVAYRRRRRKRALMAVGVIAILAALFYVTSGCAKAGATGVVRSDSAGIEIVTVPAGTWAQLPEWTIDTTASLLTFGGGDDPADDIESLGCVEPLPDGRILVCLSSPAELRIYSPEGKPAGRIGRQGAGPGEFQRIALLHRRGDTLVVYDPRQQRLTELTTAGHLVRTVEFTSIPQAVGISVMGMLEDGRLVSLNMPWELWQKAEPDGRRMLMGLDLLGPDGTTINSLPGFPGFRVIMGTVFEGGESFTTRTTQVLDGPTVLAVDRQELIALLPDTAEIVRTRADRSIRRIVRLPIVPRPVGEDFRERYIRHDSAETAASSPGNVQDLVSTYRKGTFVDHLAVFERIHSGPDHEHWLEQTWLPMESAKHVVILDSTDVPIATLTLPMRRSLWWIGRDFVWASWRDDDGVRYLSKHPLNRTPR